MEDTLRVFMNILYIGLGCLNPCFNGRYSQRYMGVLTRLLPFVLILVLMEDTLREAISLMKENNTKVLILVLMEDTLRVKRNLEDYKIPQS